MVMRGCHIYVAFNTLMPEWNVQHLQTEYSNAFSWRKMFAFPFKFSVIVRIKAWFLIAYRLYYLNRWWLSSPTNTCVTKPQWVNWDALFHEGVISNIFRYIKLPQNMKIATLYAVLYLNTLRPRQNGRHFPDDTFKCILLNENARISDTISQKFVPKGPINKFPALVQIMAWRRPGDKPLSEPMMVRLPTHICATRPQWVKSKRLGAIRQHIITWTTADPVVWHTPDIVFYQGLLS